MNIERFLTYLLKFINFEMSFAQESSWSQLGQWEYAWQPFIICLVFTELFHVLGRKQVQHKDSESPLEVTATFFFLTLPTILSGYVALRALYYFFKALF